MYVHFVIPEIVKENGLLPCKKEIPG